MNCGERRGEAGDDSNEESKKGEEPRAARGTHGKLGSLINYGVLETRCRGRIYVSIECVRGK